MTRGVSRKTGRSEGGKPKADPALVTRALELVDSGLRSAEEAAEEVGLGMRTVYRAMKAREAAVAEAPALELVILSGLPASGKSTFARELYPEHVCANRDTAGGTVADLLPFVSASLAAGRSVIVDNTLPTAADRAPFVELGRAHGARVVSVRLESTKEEALARNTGRSGAARVPDVAVHTVAKRLEAVTAREGFDVLQAAWCAPGGGFEVREVVADEIEPVPPTWRPGDLPRDVSTAIVTVAPQDKARAVRRLVAGMGGTWDGEAVESLASSWGCGLAEVQALVIEASIQAGRCALPPELAREEALAVLRWVREEAKKSADFKSVTAATAEILKIQLTAGEGEGLTKAQFVALARRLLEAVAPYPGAREAAIRVMFPGAGASGGDG